MIRFTNASVTAPGSTGPVTVLQPFSLELPEQRVALIGPNGSGKSTLARLINGLNTPTTGTVEVQSAAGEWLCTSQQGAKVRQLVSFVFTDPAAGLVLPTPLEDVALSLRRAHPRKAERLAAARAVLDQFGLGALADQSVHTLSGGQKQLLAIASALATSPQVLVADEPTTLLDLRNARRIARLLLGLPQQVIVATHDLELAAQCERVLVVVDGGIAFDGTPTAAIVHYRALCEEPA